MVMSVGHMAASLAVICPRSLMACRELPRMCRSGFCCQLLPWNIKVASKLIAAEELSR